MQVCTTCGVPKPLSEFYPDKYKKSGIDSRCKVCQKSRSSKWGKDHPEKAARRTYVSQLRLRYRMTEEAVGVLFSSQGGLCAICGKDPSTKARRRAHIDHDHQTGLVRGILCHQCNLLIGMAGDSIDVLKSAILYLEKARQQ